MILSRALRVVGSMVILALKRRLHRDKSRIRMRANWACLQDLLLNASDRRLLCLLPRAEQASHTI